ncbi:FG-GAP repeat protein, putative [Trypanosoma brucei brucei TREU927]|uniref:FG-GAP repeat protein, putative n=1 Tax=Trypanosoma brucei brucei (strain 927/4 GUTat10.1) TaxID=185431 RepID=Q381H5_TRYB2|nr:uncharacterized protein Tb11.01.7770 [Trypanosoma brucei brucei TREU927]EAN80556.1 FG-GAP repeat protein, putative [Trypanosoma brucei brucei TREU927]
MRLRDVFIVGVAIIFCIFGWHQEDGLAVWKGFEIPITDLESQRYMIPKPVVLDPMGDGRPVLIATTSYGSLEMFKTHSTSGAAETYATPVSMYQRSFFSRITAIGAGRLAVGEDYAIFVVTSDFLLYRLSPHDFSEVWSVPIHNVLSESFHTSVSVLSERIYEGDEGTVVIATQVPGPNHTKLMLFAAFNGADGKLRWRYTSDAESSVREVLDPEDAVGVGGSSPSGASVVVSSQATESFRLYEKPWTFYREAVSTLLPHRYSHPWDECLRPHVFFHTKNRKKTKAQAGNTVVVKYKDRFVRMNSEDYGELAERLGLVSKPQKKGSSHGEKERKSANVLAFHGEHGIEVVHLYTGNLITRVAPLKSAGVYYHDINDDFEIDAVSTLIGRRMEKHSHFDVDVTLDCLGVISTGAPAADHSLFQTSICNTEGIFGRLELIHRFIDGDTRGEGTPEVLSALELVGSHNTLSHTTKSVTPLVVQLHTLRGRGLFQVERLAVFMTDSGLVTCVDPSRRRVVWRSQTESSFWRLRSEREADVGEAASSETEHKQRTFPFPHLASYNFYQVNEDTVGHVGGPGRYLRVDPYIVAVGERKLTILSSRTGRVMRVVELEEPAVAPVIVQDFNGDGINDIIVVTEGGIYGFVIGTRTSSDTVTALMILMVGLLVVLFVVRQLGGGVWSEDDILPTTTQDLYRMAKRKSGRATD